MSNQPSAPVASSQQIVVFLLDGEEYAVPINEVKEVVKIPKITLVPDSPAHVLGVINLRGQILPVIDLGATFNLPREDPVLAEHVVVTELADHSLFGVQVDKVSEVMRVTPDAIKPAPKMVLQKVSADYIEGVIVLTPSAPAPSRMVLLLNLQKIVADKAPTATNH